MKKMLAKVLCAVMTSVLCLGSTGVKSDITASAASYSEEMFYGYYLKYKKVDKDEDGTYDYITITGCDKSAIEVEIPSEIIGLPVTEISLFAFNEHKNMKSITIPEGVTKIGMSAFENCSGLENIAIPENVTEIEISAFENCSSLENITIPANVKRIYLNAFSECTNLKTITIENPKTNIMDLSLTNGSTICNGRYENENYNYVYFYDGVIRGYSVSTAHEYAQRYGYKFEAIDEQYVYNLVLLKKYLVGLTDDVPETYDLNSDGIIDVFDMALLRKRLINI